MIQCNVIYCNVICYNIRRPLGGVLDGEGWATAGTEHKILDGFYKTSGPPLNLLWNPLDPPLDPLDPPAPPCTHPPSSSGFFVFLTAWNLLHPPVICLDALDPPY